MAKLLTTASEVRCPHGGKVDLGSGTPAVRLGEDAALRATDEHAVVGCPFQLPGPKPSPCVRVRWSGRGAARLEDGAPLLVDASTGECLDAAGKAQGTAIVERCQSAVTA